MWNVRFGWLFVGVGIIAGPVLAAVVIVTGYMIKMISMDLTMASMFSKRFPMPVERTVVVIKADSLA